MSVGNISEDEQLLILSYNQENSRVKCHKCSVDVLYYDKYCHNCGVELDFDEPTVSRVHSSDSEDSLVLRYAAVNLLNRLKVDPLYEGNEDFYAPFSPFTFYEVISYLLDNDCVEALVGEEKVDIALNSVPNEFLEYVLENKGINCASSKEDNIRIVRENLSLQELDAMFSGCYTITDKGEKTLKDNIKCLMYFNMYYDYDIAYYDALFENSSNKNQFLINLVEDSLEDSVKMLKWKSYSDLLFRYAQVYDFLNDYDKMLYYAVGHFICEFGLFEDNCIKDFVKIDISIQNKVKYVLARADKSYDEFLSVVDHVYDEVRIPKIFIDKDDVCLLIEELLDDNIKLRQANNHLVKLYGIERIKLGEMSFNNKDEQEKIVEELDKLLVENIKTRS